VEFESFSRPEPKINVSALLDVVFILLIFVVLAANFDRIREMNVLLPGAESSSPAQAEALILTVPHDGPLLLAGEVVTLENLRARLLELRPDYEVLLLVGDGRVDLAMAVRIFDEASAAGFESVSIATEEGRR
jgi:biopolymer transport protein ExbD